MIFGARVVKTGLAVTMSLYISMLLGMTPPIIAAVAAVFALQPSIYRSWRYMLEQLQTNTLGAALAMAASFLFKNQPIAVGVVCIFVIMICLKLKMEDTIGLTLVTVIAVMEATGPWHFALNRFLLILIGMASAFLINILFFPPKNEAVFVDQSKGVLERLSLLLRTVISNELKENVFQSEKLGLEGALKGLSDKFSLLEEEQKKLGKMSYSEARLLVVYQQMITALQSGFGVLQSAGQHYFQSERSAEVHEAFDSQLEQLIKSHEYAIHKLDGKMKLGEPEGLQDEENSSRFLNETARYALDNPDERLRLLVVAACVHDYAYQVARLHKVVEIYLGKAAAE
jgi:uncharacterized membrane protein YgaE (UPF0421/DUF939 family)